MTQMYGSRFGEVHERTVDTVRPKYRTGLTATDKVYLAANSALWSPPNQVGAMRAEIFTNLQLNTASSLDIEVWKRVLRTASLVVPTAFFKTTDNGANYTDYTTQVTDSDASTKADLDALDTLANQDYVLVAYSEIFSGLSLEIHGTNKNGNVSVMSVHYWNGTAWTAVSNLQDKTSYNGKTLNHDGEVQWTKPTDWAESTINGVTGYFARLTVSAALSAQVDIEECGVLLQHCHVGRIDKVNLLDETFEVRNYEIAGADIAVLVRTITGGTATLDVDLGWY